MYAPERSRLARPPDADPGERPSLFTAVQEQLGLKLESRRGPVPVLVIDRIERPVDDWSGVHSGRSGPWCSVLGSWSVPGPGSQVPCSCGSQPVGTKVQGLRTDLEPRTEDHGPAWRATPLGNARSQIADQPPSTGSAAPVMSAASGPQRNTISAATCSAEMKRPVGCFVAKNRRSASSRVSDCAAIEA